MPLDTEKMRRLREKRGLTQEEAARAAGLPGRQRWSAIESGKREGIRLETVERIAAALGVRARDIIADGG